ncbi:STAS domain-containing protein [Streptomyces sp. S.PB5]|uniref:STAS domain-containing protein n=1 Tax=Streptomyces sp. S.PB5 TaxID=3020844 RepID=UPI0025AEEC9D|nr:STAS domain-containing protein [Streptomyces sp. S.PB5]MDN3020734.1 STAS domain-containing protein [Streptomyces sp. S.PB5]
MPLPVSHNLDDVLVIELNEIIDIANADHIRTDLVRRLLRAPGQETSVVVVDLRCSCLTSTGVAVLEDVQDLAAALRLRLLVVATYPFTRRVLRITAVDQRLEVYPRLATALEAARRR